ncbi:MAG: hypothetical protein ACREBK_00115 [Sphingomicrobium sp.]
MIAAAFILMAAAQAPAAAPKTSLYLKCEAQGSAPGKAHQLDIVFFDPKPTWTKGFNFFDPDRILPSGVAPEVANQWPALLQIELNSQIGGNSALIQVARDPAPASTARLNIVVINAAGAPQPSYHGQCNLTEGPVAEAEFRKVVNP